MTGNSEQIPVLIVGGGPTGLTLSILLSQYGIRSLLVEADPGTCDHPQAHVVNGRTAEVLRSVGLERAMHERTDTSTLGGIWFLPSLAEPTLATFDPVKDIKDQAELKRRRLVSPSSATSCPQDIIEPLLLEKAQQGPGEIWFSATLKGLEQDNRGVSAHIDKDGQSRDVHCQWLVGCDGAASTTRGLIDVAMDGPPALSHVVGIYFHADLGPWVADRPGLLYWTVNADTPATLINLGHSRWAAHVVDGGTQESLEKFTPERCAQIVDTLVGAHVDADIRSVRPWTMTAQVARRYRRGRVFLAGDAAHRFPPTGGFGMNTGVQDAHNLAWKLAGVLEGNAGEALLDSYEAERKPVAVANSDFSLRNAKGMVSVMGKGAQQQAQRVASGEISWQALASELQALLTHQASHFDAPGRVFGFVYGGSAIVADDTPPPAVEDADRDYIPNARPGARAPHLWFQKDGEKISALDLFSRGFTLLVGPDQAAAWRQASEACAVAVNCLVVGEDVTDLDGVWSTRYGVTNGAVLVRPDGHVAWRSANAVGDPAAVLAEVVNRINARLIN